MKDRRVFGLFMDIWYVANGFSVSLLVSPLKSNGRSEKSHAVLFFSYLFHVVVDFFLICFNCNAEVLFFEYFVQVFYLLQICGDVV